MMSTDSADPKVSVFCLSSQALIRMFCDCRNADIQNVAR